MAKLYTMFLLQIHRYGRLTGNPELVSHCLDARQPGSKCLYCWSRHVTVDVNWVGSRHQAISEDTALNQSNYFGYCTDQGVGKSQKA